MKKRKKFYDYMWVISSIYLILSIFNILFAWLGILCFLVPLAISILGGEKAFCNKYCGRGQLLNLLGNDLKLSRNKSIPKFLKTKYFRYGFLIFFMLMFLNSIFNTYLVFKDKSNLQEIITIMWTFKFPWNFKDLSNVSPWISQFAFNFYSTMAKVL